jgi:hypothetical protein
MSVTFTVTFRGHAKARARRQSILITLASRPRRALPTKSFAERLPVLRLGKTREAFALPSGRLAVTRVEHDAVRHLGDRGANASNLIVRRPKTTIEFAPAFSTIMSAPGNAGGKIALSPGFATRPSRAVSEM